MKDFSGKEIFTREEIEVRKKSIFDSMGKRAQKTILKKGFENWNPFEEPKDPIDIRVDKTGNTVADIVKRFFAEYPDKKSNNAYRKIVEEMAMGVVTDDDRVKASYLFSMWYRNLLNEAGVEDDWV